MFTVYFCSDVRAMGSEFVFVFIQMMDGEKDPRNLMLCFDIVKTLATHFPLGIHETIHG